MDEAGFLAAVDAVSRASPSLSPLHAGLMVAIGAGVAADSRSFARIFGVAHALALRAAAELSGEFLEIEARDARTQRLRLNLTPAGRMLLGLAGGQKLTLS